MRLVLTPLICALAIPLVTSNPFAALQPFSVSTNNMRDLSSTLEPHLERTGFPAIAAAVVQGTNIIAAGVVGVRKLGVTNRATLQDKFHIGSCTKSITSLLAILLARERTISLTGRVDDILVDWAIPDHAAQITLQQLLQNRSGLGNTPDPNLWARAFEATGTPREQRRAFLQEFLKSPPEAKPSSTYIYSNIGYSLAGAMLETAAETSWEELVREKIFKPLGLASAGFGPPRSKDAESIDQPWGHIWRKDKAQPAPPFDNPTAIAPAGAVHISILDAARYAAFHLAAARGQIESLKPFREVLYTPSGDSEYALGWVVTERPWAGGKALTHGGSNTMFFTLIWIAPEKNLAWIVSTNVGDRENHVFSQCDKVVAELIKQFAP